MTANVTSANWKSAVLYSGASGSNVNGLESSGRVAESLGINSGGKVLTIGQTEAGKVLGSEVFKNALLAATGGNLDTTNKVMYGVLDSAGNRVQEGMWDNLSKDMVSKIRVPVETITPFATHGGTYSASELKVLLNNTNVSTIDGISRANLLTEFNSLKTTLGESAALSTVRGYISDVSYAHLHQLNYGTDSSGKLVIGADKTFFNGVAGLDTIHLPAGSAGLGAISSYFDDINLTRLGSFVSTAQFLGKYNILNTLGTAGDMLGFAVAANAAIQLYNAGNADAAQQTMLDWSIDFSGGIAGGIAGAKTAALLLAIAPLIGLTPPGMVVTALIAAGMIAGSWLGGEYGGDAIDSLLTTAANLFSSDSISPIVFNLQNNGTSGLSVIHSDNGVHFDIDADGFAEKTGWVAPDDAFLVKDVNGNGVIDSQKELFGTDAASTAEAKLKALDLNANGFVEGTEITNSGIKLWRDLNQDGISQANELFTLTSQGVTRLGTAITQTNITREGNLLDWQATWYKADGTAGGNFHDVFFGTQQEDSWYVGTNTTISPLIDPATLALPMSRGYGVTKTLHLAATENAAVKAALIALDGLALTALSQANAKMADLLYKWTGTSTITPESGGIYYNQQALTALEKLFDFNFIVTNGPNTGSDIPAAAVNTAQLSEAWADIWMTIKSRLMAQGPLHEVFSNSYYSFSEDKLFLGDSLSAILARAKSLAPASGTAAYWQEIGGVLFANANQLGGNIASIQTALNTAAGSIVSVFQNYLPTQNGNESFGASPFNDLVDGGNGNDTIWGSAGNDSILGSAGGDSLLGDDGNDTLLGGIGVDTLVGGKGADYFRYNSSDGADIFRDEGIAVETDTVFINGYALSAATFARIGTTNDIKITLSATDSITVQRGVELIAGVENIIFSGGGTKTTAQLRTELINSACTANADSITGWSFQANSINSLGGNDTVRGSDYNDTLNGDAGNDQLFGNAGNDSILGGAGLDTIDGGTQNDTIDGGADNDKLVGNFGNDSLLGGLGNDSLEGGDALDYLHGNDGNDTLVGGSGNDTLIGGVGADSLTGGYGVDIFQFFAIGDSSKTAWDRVTDFENNSDKFKLAGLGFNHVTTNAATLAGELRVYYDTTLSQTIVKSDQVNFEFHINGNVVSLITDGDFLYS